MGEEDFYELAEHVIEVSMEKIRWTHEGDDWVFGESSAEFVGQMEAPADADEDYWLGFEVASEEYGDDFEVLMMSDFSYLLLYDAFDEPMFVDRDIIEEELEALV